jgi:regulator of protease activity HflC (stomatin/prohibitin superfamily)
VFPIEFFVLKVIVRVVIALAMLNPSGLFSVNAPARTALLMSDRLTHRRHVFGPGRHIKFPWEVAVDAPVRLELTNQLMDMHLLTRDSVEVIYRVNIGYMPQLSSLPLYLRTTAQEITDKIGASVHNILKTEVSERLSTELYDQEGASRLEHLLRGYFASGSGQHGARIASGLGIGVEQVSMSEPSVSHPA